MQLFQMRAYDLTVNLYVHCFLTHLEIKSAQLLDLFLYGSRGFFFVFCFQEKRLQFVFRILTCNCFELNSNSLVKGIVNYAM